MSRKSTGTVRLIGGQWYAKWTRADGTRTPWTPLPGAIAPEDRARAQAEAARLAPRVRAASAGAAGETLDAWARRHFTWRERQGMQTHADAGRKWRAGTWGGRWGKWISPIIGSKGVATLSRDDVETVRDRLNEAVRLYYVESPKAEGATSYKNAMHVWSSLTSACKQMVSADRDSALRMREDNPARDVQPPRRPAGMKKAALRKRKHLLRPVEFAHLLGCAAISLDWRRAYAVLAYAYLRPGEARPLKWEDVDLAAGVLHVRRAWDFERGRVKRTKSGAGRDVPIEASLCPLLECMREEANGAGLVLPCLSAGDWTNWSVQFRDRLQVAGIERPELHEGSATEKAFGFRQLRDLGITMRLWRGDNPLIVQRHAGHESLSTLQAYAVEFEHWTPADGVPFPALSAGLLESSLNVPGRFKPSNYPANSCERRELKPPPKHARQPGKQAESSKAPEIESSTIATPRHQAPPNDSEVRHDSTVSLDGRPAPATPGVAPTEAELEAAVANLTRLLAKTDDVEAAVALVDERKEMRLHLEARRRALVPENLVDATHRFRGSPK